ncbi:rod shape-determining protein MreC [Serpentinicella alkaliphila]|uniref:Cell shape-determining protein MreC n=1 Tax=Serpentinicella alkaliphila TaxID=1734049 RepID=A0A4R2TX32_9FIRM|nr:rod shape-determining protein MreC [Serpentinicella alkaliphila]QUH26056.1 rod shape-determining protein MreC [Serpentinicella alkaliphila]TCP99752.1 rod shape-determining protein MreC [Serpentinicella alkaliphila]
MAKDNKKNRSAIIVTSVVIALIIVVGITSNQRENLHFIEKWLGNVITPIQKSTTTGINFVRDAVNPVVNYSRIKRENDGLRSEVEDLREQIIKARLERDELEELRSLSYALNYVPKEENYRHIAANIVSKNPGNWFDTFVIDIGEENGVKLDSVVVSSNGLVGRVFEVGGNWSKVISIIDNNSSVSFQIMRNKNFKGIITGSVNYELSGYLFDPLAEVIVGDKLLTSGLGIYPSGILIGEVIEVSRTTDQLLKTITVEPSVNFKRLNKVLVYIPLN